MKLRGPRPPPGLCRNLVLPLVLLVIALVGGDVRNNEVTDNIAKVLKSDEPLTDFAVTPQYIYVGGTNVIYQVQTEDFVIDALQVI